MLSVGLRGNGVFFVHSLLASTVARSWQQSVSSPLSAQWLHVASTTFAVRPGLPQGDVTRTKEIRRTKERDNRKRGLPPLALSCCRADAGRGKEYWRFPRSQLLCQRSLPHIRTGEEVQYRPAACLIRQKGSFTYLSTSWSLS